MSTTKKTRKRTLILKSDNVYDRAWRFSDANLYLNRSVFNVVGTQVTESEGHPWSDHGYRGVDIGGPFWTQKKYSRDNRKGNTNTNPMFSFTDIQPSGSTSEKQFGPLYAVNPNDVAPYNNPPSAASSPEELDAWGTKAIALCKPTNSVADLSTALGELAREGLPSMVGAAAWQSRLKDIRSSGDEYLNVTFGWLPLVSDIRKAAISVNESRKILAQYERDAGRLVRRRYEFPLQVDIGPVEFIDDPNEPYRPQRVLSGKFYDFVSPSGDLYRQRKTVTKRWFSGAFTYYLPSGYDSRSVVDRAGLAADRIYGLSVDPETLWNLAPWSWAVDWATNIGDVISNVSDFITDGLLLRYGYMMEHTIVTDTYTRHVSFKKGYGKTTLVLEKITETKQRRPATPFGFGLTFDGLSTKQKAICAALGITRVR